MHTSKILLRIEVSIEVDFKAKKDPVIIRVLNHTLTVGMNLEKETSKKLVTVSTGRASQIVTAIEEVVLLTFTVVSIV